MFFEGSVAEAIAASRREVKPLVVLLTGVGDDSVRDALLALRQEAFVTGCIVLALEDDLANSDPSAFRDAKHFRAFCPVEQLPAVVMVSPAGAVLTKAAGAAPPEELRGSLAAAYDAFVQQQASLVAAQAALMAMAAGGGGRAPASAAGAANAAATGTAPPLPDPADAAAGGAAAAERAAAPAAPPSGGEEAPAAEQPSVPAEEPPAAEQAGPAAAPAPAQPDVAPQPYRLQFKCTDGAVLLGDFTGGTLLADVFAWIDERRAAAGACRGLAYVLVQAAPRLVLGAGQEGLALAAAGLAPRTSLQVIPHAALGHRPPPPPAAEAGQGGAGAAAGEPDAAQQQQQQREEGAQGAQQGATQPAAAAADLHTQLREACAAAAAAQQQQQQGREQRRQAAAARAEAAAGPPPPPPRPTEIQLQVRLRNGDSLRAAFPSGSRLAAVYDWLDAERTDRGPYRLYQPFPRRVFYAGDLDSTLLELGFGARTALQLDLLPPRGRARAPAPAVAAAPAAAAGAVEPPPAAARAAPAAAAVPGDFVLQFKLTDGGQLRASFPPEATLQQVVHHLDTHRTDGGAPYALVQPLPKRRFAPEDLPLPLSQLGLQQRQLLLLEPLAGGGGGGGGGWSLRGALAAAASYLNPYAYLRGGPAGTAREQQEGAAAPAAPSSAAAAEQLPSGGAAAATTRKRAHAAAASPNIHTLSGTGGGSDDGREEGRDPGGNSYWNGNSTQFGAPPPEDR